MKDNQPIIVKQLFDVPVITVWRAITELKQMQQWYFPNIPEFQPEIDFETRFLLKNEGRSFTHIWKVKEVVLHKMIGYSWNFEEYSGEGYSTFELAKKDGKTQLTLKSFVIEEFPNDILEFKRSLKAILEKSVE